MITVRQKCYGRQGFLSYTFLFWLLIVSDAGAPDCRSRSHRARVRANSISLRRCSTHSFSVSGRPRRSSITTRALLSASVLNRRPDFAGTAWGAEYSLTRRTRVSAPRSFSGRSCAAVAAFFTTNVSRISQQSTISISSGAFSPEFTAQCWFAHSINTNLRWRQHSRFTLLIP
jgi:hypothetical protein